MNKTLKAKSRSLFGVLDTTKILLSAIFISLVIIPLLVMFSNMDMDSIQRVLNTPNFKDIVVNSLTVGGVATAISVIGGYLLARAVHRSGVKGKELFGMLFTVPMLVPSISLGMGLIMLLGNNGIITKLLGLEKGIYGMWGIILGSVLYSLPVAYLMFSDILKYEDASPYEAAKILGISKLRQFRIITLPYLKKPLISIIFAIFTLIVTDYGVPTAVGGVYKTIPVLMYEEVVGNLDFGKGAVLGAFLLIPALIAFIFDLTNKDTGNNTWVTRQFDESKSLAEKTLAYALCIFAAVFTVSPAISFVLLSFTKGYPNDITLTFDNIVSVMDKAASFLGNSVVIAVFVALFGCVIAFLSAYLSARMKSPSSKFLHLSSVTSAAIPGLVLGLSYAMTFSGSGIYNTLIILVMVNTVHFISSPYLMMYNSFSKLNMNLESVGDTLGISRVKMLKDVFLPQSLTTLLEMFSYFFVNCMMTISAVSFLSSTKTMPVSLLINQYQALSKPEFSAVVSMMILLINVAVKCIFKVIKNKAIKK